LGALLLLEQPPGLAALGQDEEGRAGVGRGFDEDSQLALGQVRAASKPERFGQAVAAPAVCVGVAVSVEELAVEDWGGRQAEVVGDFGQEKRGGLGARVGGR